MCFIKVWIKISVRVGGRDIQNLYTDKNGIERTPIPP